MSFYISEQYSTNTWKKIKSEQERKREVDEDHFQNEEIKKIKKFIYIYTNPQLSTGKSVLKCVALGTQ